MNSITAQEWELLSFFEAEPEFLDPEVPWAYNDALYRVRVKQNIVSFAVQPAYRDVRLILSIDDLNVYELSAMGVADVRYRKESGIETIEILLHERNSVVLSLKPHVQIRQEWGRELNLG